jgi:hypothetical protein
MECGCGSARNVGSYLTEKGFAAVVAQAGAAFARKRIPVDAQDIVIGAIVTPGGALYTGAIAMQKNASAGHVHIPVGKYSFDLTAHHDSGAHTITVEDEFRDGDKVLVSSKWTLYIAPPDALNRQGYLVSEPEVHVDASLSASKDCFINCLKRHAPGCIGLCEATGWGNAACLACIGGSAICCKINCHC